MEIIGKMGFFEKYTAAEQDRLSMSFFGDGSELITQELVRLLGSSVTREQIREDWCE